MPDFAIFNKCNNNCVMCPNGDDFKLVEEGKFNLINLTNRIERFKHGENEFLNNYTDVFSLGGGEPTINPFFDQIIHKLKHSFPGKRILCLTNGRRFYYDHFANYFLNQYDKLDLIIPLHGYNSRVHDMITRVPGSFLETVEGIKNLFKFRKPTNSIEIRVVIHKLNYKHLEDILEFIINKFPSVDRVVFIFFEIEGQALKNLKQLKLTYSILNSYIQKLYSWIPYIKEIRFYHFPLCTIPPKFFPYIWRTLPDQEVSYLKDCDYCKVKEFCLGIHKNYLRYIGSGEFNPILNNIDVLRGNNWHRPIINIAL